MCFFTYPFHCTLKKVFRYRVIHKFEIPIFMQNLRRVNYISDGESVLRADVHRPRPGVVAAGRAGAPADGRPRRLPQLRRSPLHPPHAAAAHRAARLALAAARLRRPLLLPLLEIIPVYGECRCVSAT